MKKVFCIMALLCLVGCSGDMSKYSTADELVSVCMRKLALQSMGISEESQSTAQSIIQNLKAFGSAN